MADLFIFENNNMILIFSESFEGNNEDKEYLRAVKVRTKGFSAWVWKYIPFSLQDAARAKALRAKFEEWEAQVGEDGGYINLVDENGLPLETASKLKNRYELQDCINARAIWWSLFPTLIQFLIELHIIYFKVWEACCGTRGSFNSPKS